MTNKQILCASFAIWMSCWLVIFPALHSTEVNIVGLWEGFAIATISFATLLYRFTEVKS